MKRRQHFPLRRFAVLTLLILLSSEAAAAGGCQPGDVAPLSNVDGQVTVADAAVALRSALGMVPLENVDVSGMWEVRGDPADPPRLISCSNPLNNQPLDQGTLLFSVAQYDCSFNSTGINVLSNGNPFWVMGAVRLNQLQAFEIDPDVFLSVEGAFELPTTRLRITRGTLFIDPGCTATGTYLLALR